MSQKNKEFDLKYNLKHKDKIEIVKSLTVDDCTDIRPNDNPRYPEADVFIFLKEKDILCYGETEAVLLYIKEYIIDQNTMEMVTVISFHESRIYES